MMEQQTAKGNVRWPSVSEIFVTKSVLWWVWEALSTPRSAGAYPYSTLMPSEDFSNSNWTSSVVAFQVSSEIDEIAALWQYSLPLFVATAGACVVIYLRKRSFVCEEIVALVAEPKGSMVEIVEKTPEDKVPSKPGNDAGRQLVSFEKKAIAISTIKEVIGLTSAEPCPTAKCTSPASATSIEETNPGEKGVINKIETNLAISEISITIDIPPSSPGQSDDADIVELSELLERW